MTDRRLADLKQFTGSEEWYRHALNRRATYTQGARCHSATIPLSWGIGVQNLNAD